MDKLPFSTPEKAQRYQTENYRGAMGLNWYLTDPTLQFIMAYYLRPDELAFAEPHLTRIGELTGGPVTRWAEETDRNPPRLERYDRWGHDISRVVLPESFIQSKRAVIEARQAVRDDAARAGVKPSLALFAADYLLNQADIGMACALATGGNMVRSLVTAYAPPDVREFVLGKLNSGEWDGEAAQLLTERAGGSDLGALETTATRSGDVWLLNGFKWFASNCAGEAFVVLAKPEGAPDSTRGVATFLVLRTRRDGSRNGVRIRRLKDKLGTRSVASGEIEFVDAEAFLLSGEPSADAGPSDGKGLTRMMELTKVHEEVVRGSLDELAIWAAGGVLGEITVVVAGAAPHAELSSLIAQVEEFVAAGIRVKDACSEVAAAHPGVRTRQLYDAVLQSRRETGGPAQP